MRGRFVADQVAAIAATGRARPRVVIAAPVSPGGRGPDERDRRTADLRAWFASGIRDHPALFASRGWASPAGIPVARLGVVEANRPRDGRLGTLESRRAALRPLAERLAQRPPALVHAHGLFPDGIAAGELAAELGVPFIVTEHSSTLTVELADPAIREAAAVAATRAAAILAVGADLAAELRGLLPEAAHLVSVGRNAVDVAAFHAAPLEERDPEALLWVGSRGPAKGIEMLLRAFALVRAARPGATLRLIGRAPRPEDDEAWRDLASELGIAAAVSFEAPVDRAGVAAAMARASIFVHPSRRDTFGVVAAEALAAGLPVVATRTAVARILEPDTDALGALVAIDDAPAFAAATLRVLERRTSYDPARLRAAVVGRFDAATVAGQVVDLYEAHARPSVAPADADVADADVAAEPRPSDPDVAAPPRPPDVGRQAPVVLATSRERAAALGDLPAEVLAGAVIVAPVSAARALAAAGRRVVAIEGPRVTFRAGRALRAVTRLARGGPARSRAAAALAALGAAVAERNRSAPPELVPLDGADAAIALAFASSHRVVPVPGGVAWLADRAASEGAADSAFGGTAPDPAFGGTAPDPAVGGTAPGAR